MMPPGRTPATEVNIADDGSITLPAPTQGPAGQQVVGVSAVRSKALAIVTNGTLAQLTVNPDFSVTVYNDTGYSLGSISVVYTLSDATTYTVVYQVLDRLATAESIASAISPLASQAELDQLQLTGQTLADRTTTLAQASLDRDRDITRLVWVAIAVLFAHVTSS
jgi:hypothetical protein